MSEDFVQALRTHDLDFITASEASNIELKDDKHLEYAAAHGLAVYSFNIKDFYKLHGDFLERGDSHAGIILCRQKAYSIGEQLRRLLKLIDTLSAEDMQNRVEFLSSWG